MKIIGVQVVGCALVALVLARLAGAEEDEYIYPDQAEIEAKLNGTPEEKRAYALLLPMRIDIALSKQKLQYQEKALAKIEKEKMVSALPFIEQGLRFPEGRGGRTYWGMNDTHAARVWVNLRTLNMTEQERATFLASTFQPGFEYYVQDMAFYNLKSMGNTGRRAVMDMLFNLTKSFTKESDVLIASNLAGGLRTSESITLTAEEAARLAGSDNPYQQYVALAYFKNKRDPGAVELAKKLVDSPEAARFPMIVDGVMYDLADTRGADAVFAEVLRKGREGEPSFDKEAWVSAAVTYVQMSMDGCLKRPSAELRREIEYVAAREIDARAYPGVSREFVLSYQYDSRERAKKILKFWNEEPKRSPTSPERK